MWINIFFYEKLVKYKYFLDATFPGLSQSEPIFNMKNQPDLSNLFAIENSSLVDFFYFLHLDF